MIIKELIWDLQLYNKD